MIWACIAAASWCLAAYMVPVVAVLVWLSRRRDKTEIIQTEDVDDVII